MLKSKKKLIIDHRKNNLNEELRPLRPHPITMGKRKSQLSEEQDGSFIASEMKKQSTENTTTRKPRGKNNKITAAQAQRLVENHKQLQQNAFNFANPFQPEPSPPVWPFDSTTSISSKLRFSPYTPMPFRNNGSGNVCTQPNALHQYLQPAAPVVQPVQNTRGYNFNFGNEHLQQHINQANFARQAAYESIQAPNNLLYGQDLQPNNLLSEFQKMLSLNQATAAATHSAQFNGIFDKFFLWFLAKPMQPSFLSAHRLQPTTPLTSTETSSPFFLDQSVRPTQLAVASSFPAQTPLHNEPLPPPVTQNSPSIFSNIMHRFSKPTILNGFKALKNACFSVPPFSGLAQQMTSHQSTSLEQTEKPSFLNQNAQVPGSAVGSSFLNSPVQTQNLSQNSYGKGFLAGITVVNSLTQHQRFASTLPQTSAKNNNNTWNAQQAQNGGIPGVHRNNEIQTVVSSEPNHIDFSAINQLSHTQSPVNLQIRVPQQPLGAAGFPPVTPGLFENNPQNTDLADLLQNFLKLSAVQPY
eukprot:NP_508512.1 Uncharacterized protein CELE_Y41G9A.6 [Caenorhabditis elegans]